ncbi:hypothetical protein M408DRAFT_23076 [Serendipita vermifera MAFF 305830]|uniref:DUF6533 domain-containing protein n=1 Tax=Serendipita vermifera MAFF 305830 TaxID=933852 RepID=A0A0C3BCW7_SERVB|nr:hypothetical protein M408DRAFT_23076 [Serendipita vermifera MAFF 305830]
MLDDIARSRYLAGAAITLVIYDSILLIQTERQTIWASKWTFPKLLYYFIRICTIPFLAIAAYDLVDFRPALSNRFCEIWLALISVPQVVTFAAGNWLFTLRLIALYKQRRALVWFLRIFFVATYTVSGTFLVLTLTTYQRLGLYYNPIPKCCYSSYSIPHYSSPLFYSTASYEVLLFSLTVYRAYRDAHLITNVNNRLLVVLYRDGAAAFLIMLTMKTWNIWVFTSQPVSSTHIATNIYWALYAVLITRTYLNIVWLVRQPPGSTTLTAGTNLSSAPSTTFGGTPIGPITRKMSLKKPQALVSDTLFEEEEEKEERHQNGHQYPPSGVQPTYSHQGPGSPGSTTSNTYSYRISNPPPLPPIELPYNA